MPRPKKQKRRGRNEGSIYQLKAGPRKGEWAGAVTLGYFDGKRQRKAVRGDSFEAVREQIATIVRDRDRGLVAPQAKAQTVEQFLTSWLESKKRTRSPGTYYQYHSIANYHLIPTFGQVALPKLTPEHVQLLINKLHDAGLSPTMLGHVRDTLRAALSQAMKWGIVSRNVAALVEMPRGVRYNPTLLTPDELNRLLEVVTGTPLEMIVTLVAATGLRLGEALGLRWADVDLEHRVMRIRHSISMAGGTLYESGGKSEASRGDIILPRQVAMMLRQWRKDIVERRLLAGPRWKDHDLVFPSSIGTPWRPGNVRRLWTAALITAELPHMRFHDLRHSCASLLAAEGVPQVYISKVLRHSRQDITSRIYTHALPEVRQLAADAMDRILSNPKSEEDVE